MKKKKTEDVVKKDAPRIEFVDVPDDIDDLFVDEDCIDDAVEHPSHYVHGHMEVIEVIAAFSHLHFFILTAVQYLLRAPFKNGVEDIDKAIWYLKRMKELMQAGDPGYRKMPEDDRCGEHCRCG